MRRWLAAAAAGFTVMLWGLRAAAQAPAAVTVHVDAPRPVRIEALGPDGWKSVCTSPCDAPLPVGVQLRANADDMRASEPMTLAAGAHATLTVEPAEKRSKVAPIVVTVIGTLGLVPVIGVTGALGTVLIIAGLVVCPVAAAFGAAYGKCTSDALGVITPLYGLPYVWIPAVAGVGVIGVGVAWLAASNGSTPTTVTQTAAAAVPRWDVATTPIVMPPVTTLPLWRGSF